MKDNNVAPSTLRAKKSKALKAKRDKAATLGVTIIEGSLVVVHESTFQVLQWDEGAGDYVLTLTGRLG